ncbi:translation initiation factor IF-2 [Geitlerinema sp. PCC 9228]|uniref:translation initiation factor IF-2 n=1 Tax=Geitlerinema sp. PCC 9228 TaxID=111611 RepID=UPI0008F9C68C|nr:translation initiation factor IF-2 [Geitlerinema sp. PCC 9228]
MNNRVRIYELSKELNLDNKDILAVCEQLNIAVKSHSSTISESDAERIRTYASQYVSAGDGRHVADLTHGHSKENHKQEILEIRKHTTSEATSPAAPPQKPQPPRPPVSPEPESPPAQPATSNQTETGNGDGETPATETTEAKPSQPPATPSNGSATASPAESSAAQPAKPVEQPTPPQAPKQPETERSQQPAAAEAPQLTPPPVRPNPPQKPKASQPENPSEGAAESGQSQSEKPTPQLKRPVPKPKKPEAPAQPAAKEKPEKPAKPAKESSDSGQATTGSRKPSRPASPQKSEAAATPTRPKPKPPKQPPEGVEEQETEDTSASDSEENSETTTSETEKQAKRPKPPRSSKKNKKREKREPERESAEKAKPAKKAKRPKPIKDEDEEDIDSSLSVDEGNSTVNRSMERPPKPNQPAAKAGPPKPSKPAAPKKKSSSDKGSESTAASRRAAKQQSEQKQRPEEITVKGDMTVQELAELLVVPETEIVKRLFMKGIAANVTQSLDTSTIEMVASEIGVQVKTEAEESAARKSEFLEESDLEHLELRPPVVTVMGHVDHGKTTLLDSIRKTNVASGEAGGITQHIGAYHVEVEHNGSTEKVVFLDTPGHEAFTAMRARGARVTDIAILVVSADDGVQPQTVEAISHAKAAGIPLVVAINKIDKEGAQPDRVKQELMEHGLVPEEWGGETIMVPVSAVSGENLETLLEMLLLVAEIEQLSANPNRPARGTVIEAHLDKSRGPVANLLVQNGTLRVGDALVVGPTFGRVRATIDDRGERVEEVGPSSAVQILGLNDVPSAGDDFEVFENEKDARALAEKRAEEQRQSRILSRGVTLGSLSAQVKEGELKQLNLILKADVQGSVEAIRASLKQLPQKEVQIRLLLAAPGEISEADVDLAAASDAVIIGFNTTFAPGSRTAADRAGVDVREYNVIYNLLSDVKAAMEGLLEPELVEEDLGEAEVRAVFPVGRGTVAGCYVRSGKLVRNSKLRVKRGNELLYEGNIDSLKRVKDDVKEVQSGYECGVGTNNFNDWKEGDSIECYRMATKRRTLSE